MPIDSSSGLPPAALAALQKGQKIEAIKVVRQERALGLKEAKDAVEAYLHTEPELAQRIAAMQAEGRAGCLRWLGAIIFLLALASYWYWSGKS